MDKLTVYKQQLDGMTPAQREVHEQVCEHARTRSLFVVPISHGRAVIFGPEGSYSPTADVFPTVKAACKALAQRLLALTPAGEPK